MSEREDSPHHHHLHHHLPPSPRESLCFFFKILFHSLQIFSRNKRHFLSIFLLLSLPLSLLLFTLSLSSHPLKSHILHLESVLRHSPTRFEFRHVFSESRNDAFSLLRLRAAFFLPIYAFSLFLAVSTVSSTLLSFQSKRPSLKSALSGFKNSWTRPLVTTICIYTILVAYSIVPNTLASISPSPALRFVVLVFGVVFEVYLISIMSLGLVVSIAEERFGFDAIRYAAALMADRRLSGSILTAMFLFASSLISSEMEGLMDGVDHWMRSTAAVTTNVAVSVGDKIGLISLYGMVIIFGYVVTTVFYCECRKRDFVRVENEEDHDHIVMV
ncbi:uncharacterized protein E5676_scaffold29G00150 [Cucumis melo var. makuwa]|uniref:Uncharacterized protein LOC127149584 n=2 Tax=Cucumis melo TaxID=3656 RepID=A0A9I9CIH1_CUCME|nr:uncharacterized protein LOC127149584 [Cucumis melo]KAA0055589.1 hypothetical protein E6C27_scaffold222G00710 [Cucumis melo var. makuwa]TYK01336.1 uncharacterized protein E5676_scaffold29G00150 [Cucumis melo var. makuwa]